MTPQERELVTALFDRLAALEQNPRDPEAERLIAQGVARAPHAIYPLVQTVLLQDEALKRANARIEELEGNASEPRSESFLDAVRNTVLGPAAGSARGSVPSVRPSTVWNTGQASYGAAPQPMPGPMTPGPMAGAGGSFLGTAAAAAVGMIGGSLLFNGIRGLMAGGHPAARARSLPDASFPQGEFGCAVKASLPNAAGVDDVGANQFTPGDSVRSAGPFDTGSDNDPDYLNDDLAGGDFGGDGTSDA